MKKAKVKKIGIGAAVPVAVIAAILLMANIGNLVTNDDLVDIVDIIDDILLDDNEIEEKMEWHTEFEWYPLAENTPAAQAGGFMSIFLLDYAEVAATVLANNATDWNASADVHGYADWDGFSEDAVSEDPFYVVVRARFTQAQAMGAGAFNGSRCRVTITASGDETISQTIVGNGSAETYGGGIESDNDSTYTHLYINFFFDDNSDGYRILDDGSLTISLIKIEAKY